MEQKWIKICESYEYLDSKLNLKIWLHDLLDENNIPYKNEVESYWEGSVRTPEYKEKLIIYIPSEYQKQVEEYISDYNSPDNILSEDIEEFECEDDSELDAQNIENRQRKMLKIMGLVIFGMILTVILCAIFV